MNQGPVYQFVRKEMCHYGVKAVLVHEPDLPSFEIRSEKRNAVIAAPSDAERSIL